MSTLSLPGVMWRVLRMGQVLMHQVCQTYMDTMVGVIANYADRFLVLKQSVMGHSVAMMNDSTRVNVETSVTIHLDIDETEVSL